MYVPVDAIVKMDRDGVIVPLKLKVFEDDDEHILKVISSVPLERSRMGGNEVIFYRVDVVVGNIRKTMKIMYEVHSCIWKIEGRP